VAFFLARASKQPDLQYAIRLIILSNILMRFWLIAFPHQNWGLGVIDFVLLAAFLDRMGPSGRGWKLLPLVVLQGLMLCLHLAATMLDFSGSFLGAERSHFYVETWWRNRLFEAVNAWIILGAGTILIVRNSKTAQRQAIKLVQGWRFSTRFATHLLHRFWRDRFSDKQAKR